MCARMPHIRRHNVILQQQENHPRNQVPLLLASHAFIIETSTLFEILNGSLYGQCPYVAKQDVFSLKQELQDK